MVYAENRARRRKQYAAGRLAFPKRRIGMVLEKIKSNEKKQELLEKLHKSHPNHQERQWLVGFLGYVGYSYFEICGIIHDENRWKDYDHEYTNYQVSTVLLGSRRSGKQNSTECVPSSQPRRALTWSHVLVDYSKHKEHCSIGCERCTDCKCVEALRYVNELHMSNMQRTDP